jgi:RNA polymerase sigma-70 factor (ECF subfamily)
MVYTTGHAEDARDVVQDAFVQAFLKLGTFQQTSAFFTWLYRIAANLAATQRRRKRPTASVEQMREVAGLDPVDRAAGPGERAELAERRQHVHDAILQLSEEHRVVLVLREIDGRCYEHIAKMLDLPVGTVRSRLHRARLQLREQLKEVLGLDDCQP